MNKLCDGADWFRPEFDHTIRQALEEPPRCHRKQWEFAALYRALETHRMLEGDKEAISFGSGTERLLYAISRRVRHVWATDLYDMGSSWDTARTGDAGAFVRAAAPFSFPQERLDARRMDMREIDFPDRSFDFAWSSCAIEHIGGQGDFLRHLREVHRVLRPGGIYALTTELTFLPDTIAEPGNYLFSRSALEEIARQGGFELADGDAVFDARLTEHAINTPLPLELTSGLNDGEGAFNERLFGSLSHLQLANANVPFTSCVLTLRRAEPGRQTAQGRWHWDGFEQSARFIDAGLSRMRQLVEASELVLHPFAGLPDRRSPLIAGHESFFSLPRNELVQHQRRDALHTAYMWLGARPRTLRLQLTVQGIAPASFVVRLQRLTVRNPPGRVETIGEQEVRTRGGVLTYDLSVEPADDARYALVARVKEGTRTSVIDGVWVTALPAGATMKASGTLPLFDELSAAMPSLRAARNLVRRLRAPLRGG